MHDVMRVVRNHKLWEVMPGARGLALRPVTSDGSCALEVAEAIGRRTVIPSRRSCLGTGDPCGPVGHTFVADGWVRELHKGRIAVGVRHDPARCPRCRAGSSK